MIQRLRMLNILSLFIYCLLCSILTSPTLQAQQNVLGKPGYIFTPKGQWSDQPKVSFGMVSIPQAHAINHFMGAFHDELMYHAAVDITDFLRVNLNMTYLPEVDRIGIGDRHLDFSVRLWKERSGQWIPDVSVFFTLPQLSSPADYLSYQALVLTKSVPLHAKMSLTGSVGYGIPFFYVGVEGLDKDRQPLLSGFARKERINNFYLNGLFGAVQLSYLQKGGLMLEHDGRAFHAGGYVHLWKEKLSVQINAYGLETLGYGLHFTLPLDVRPREYRRSSTYE